MKAKLEEAEKAELQSQHNEQSGHLKSYSSRFRRPGESRDTNSQRSLSEYRKPARDYCSWRKKDSRFINPNDSEAYDKKNSNDEVRTREPTTDVKPQQVPVTSETTRSQIPARKASKSCNYKYIFYFEYYTCILVFC